MDTFVPPPTDSPGLAERVEASEPLLSIAAVERETGLGKDTLRAWERRYGFPVPQRDASGVRGYPRSLVDKLRLVRRALLKGQRPGRLLALPPDELNALLAEIEVAPGLPVDGAVLRSLHGLADGAPEREALDVKDCIAAMRAGGGEALRHWLTRGLARMGLGDFVIRGIAPLTIAIGDFWLRGGIAVYEEHLYSEAVQSVLRVGLLPFQAGLETSAPRVLLTTVPGEEHGLGLLMAESLMTLEACRCLSLGVQTPVGDIVDACLAHRIDVVALSFSESMQPALALGALADLRSQLPLHVEIWAGGGAPVLRSSRIDGIQIMPGLVDIVEAVARWRKVAGPRSN